MPKLNSIGLSSITSNFSQGLVLNLRKKSRHHYSYYIAKKLEDAFTKAVQEPEFIDGMKKFRWPIVYRNSRELGEYVARNVEIYSKFLMERGLAK